MTKNQTIDLLRNQLPGFYSVEQVINLIEKIEEATTTISSERIDTITRSIVETLEDEHSNNNLVNLDDIELDFNNWDRKITINDVPMDFNLIRDLIEQELINSFDFEGEVEEEEND
jgi:hypothetical protein